MTVEIVQATLEHEPLMKSLWGLFLHDLSEFTDESWMGENGEWQPPWRPWQPSSSEETNKPKVVQTFLIRVDNRPAGYAVLAFAPRVFVSPGREIAASQLFILQGYRRRGIGRQFAHTLFDRFPGKWEVGYWEQNVPAAQFWNEVVNEYTQGDVVQCPVYYAPDPAPMSGLNSTSTNGRQGR